MMRREGVRFVQSKPVEVHPMKEYRRVPQTQLRKRLILGQDGEIRVNGRVFQLRLENARAVRKGAHPRMIA